MTSNALDAKAVIDQFQESQQTLDQLRERLRAVMQAEGGATHAAASIEAASRTLGATATALDQAAGEMQAVREATVDALRAAQTFLSGTDLGALREEVRSLAAETRAGADGLRKEVSELSSRVPQVEQVRAEVEALKQQIPARTRKKMGI